MGKYAVIKIIFLRPYGSFSLIVAWYIFLMMVLNSASVSLLFQLRGACPLHFLYDLIRMFFSLCRVVISIKPSSLSFVSCAV